MTFPTIIYISSWLLVICVITEEVSRSTGIPDEPALLQAILCEALSYIRHITSVFSTLYLYNMRILVVNLMLLGECKPRNIRSPCVYFIFQFPLRPNIPQSQAHFVNCNLQSK